MPVSIACPSCASRLRVLEQALGKRAKCPKCGNMVLLAQPGGAPKPPAPAQAVTAQPPAGARRPPALPTAAAPAKQEVAPQAAAPASARRVKPPPKEEVLEELEELEELPPDHEEER